MPPTPVVTLKGVTIYLPGGEVKQLKAEEIAGYDEVTLVTNHDGKLTRYVGFPMVIHLETSNIVVAGVGLGEISP